MARKSDFCPYAVHKYCGTGDGGPAINAQLNSPSGLALDTGGNLYIADFNNHRVRVVSRSGIINTIAGNGVLGYSGDGGSAVGAQLSFPDGLAMDSSGNLYVADSGNNAIRVLQPTGSGIQSITNGASNLPSGPVSPGEIVVLYGSGLGPASLVQGNFGSAGPLANQLAGTTVSFNGVQTPIIYTSANQVATIVPYSLSGSAAPVNVTYQGQTTSVFTVTIALAAPGLFTLDSTGKGQAAAVNQDGSISTTAMPATSGDVILLYATGNRFASAVRTFARTSWSFSRAGHFLSCSFRTHDRTIAAGCCCSLRK